MESIALLTVVFGLATKFLNLKYGDSSNDHPALHSYEPLSITIEGLSPIYLDLYGFNNGLYLSTESCTETDFLYSMGLISKRSFFIY